MLLLAMFGANPPESFRRLKKGVAAERNATQLSDVRADGSLVPRRSLLVSRRLDNIHSRLLQLLSYGVDDSHLQPQTYTLAGPSARGSQTAQGHLLRGRRPRSSWIRCPTSFNPVARSSPAYRGAFEGAPNVVVAEEQAFGAPGV